MVATRSTLVRAALITAIAEIATLVVFFLIRSAIGEAIAFNDWIETMVIPLIVGMPIATYVVAQADKLRIANEQMLALNEAREQSHRQLQQAHDLIAFAARHDRMTGLLNREGFLDELTKAHEAEEDSILLIVDADFFKTINDRHGHHAGDSALVAIAKAIRRAARPIDLVGRIGGEEFGVLLRSLSISSAAEAGERIRLEVANTEWAIKGVPVPLSVSIGGAAIRDFPEGVTALMVHADTCLYEAKRSGRNRIAFHYGEADVARAMAMTQRRATLQ